MGKTIRIGIDFGTTFCFAGFEHGETVMSLIPSKENYGIPSVFYADDSEKLVGRLAEKRGESLDDKTQTLLIRSVKRQLTQTSLGRIGGVTYTPEMVVHEIIQYVVSCAEDRLEAYMQDDYDRMEAVITVPVDFTEPMKNLIRTAAAGVVLHNGSKLCVTGLLPEPVAAAIEYFGMRQETEGNILVFDLGGGTLDVAIVRACKNGATPYEVVAQNGDKALGGDEWDKSIAEWLSAEYIKQYARVPGEKQRELFRYESRKIKENLTELKKDKVNIPLGMGQYMQRELTIENFEAMTKPLLDRAIAKVRELLNRRKDLAIDRVILTGGSSYMPQIKKALKTSGLFAEKTDIRLMEPERAIAYGAARYAATRVWDADGEVGVQDKAMIKLITSHAYGIGYYYGDDYKIEVLIPSGVALPYTGTTTSVTRRENQKSSLFRVWELDGDHLKGDKCELSSGRNIMQVTLKRTADLIPKGSETEDKLTISEDEILYVESTDKLSGIKAKNQVSIKRVIDGGVDDATVC